MGLFKLLQFDAMFRYKKFNEGRSPSRTIKDMRGKKASKNREISREKRGKPVSSSSLSP